MEVPSRIEVLEGRKVELTWSDGRIDLIDASTLRAACECAGCREAAGIEATRLVMDAPELIGISEAKLVGAYAVGFTFTPDGHRTGIFPFDRLRALGDQAA